jgi:NAD(P)-dependent dehydrogenase (short-subunit alcohol dehydrogenase family)
VNASTHGQTTYLIVGGSSGLGRALAERFARAGHALVLVSSDLRDTSALASDLGLRYRVSVTPVLCDLAQPRLDFGAIDAALAALPPLAGVLLPAGMNRADDRPGQAPEAFDAITSVNYASPSKIVDHYLPMLRAKGHIVGFGSVAAVRGRTRNAAYGAAKRALAAYFESLRHAVGASGVVVQFYVLGYLDTHLAFGHDTPLPRAAPEACAERVFRRRERDFGRAYFPSYWRPLCFVLRLLPWFVFRRLSL